MSYPYNMVDTCDYEILTVFPIKRGECSAAPDDYEVENYAVGMYGAQPALCKMGEGNETLLVLDEKSGVQTAPSLQSSRSIPKKNEKNAATTD